MNNPIRFAGLTLNWSEAYARSYASYLTEIGFYAKLYCGNDRTLVVYCHRPFTNAEVETALEMFSEQPKE